MISYIESERLLLSSVLLGSKETQESITAEVTAADFYEGSHQRIFKAVLQILEDGLEVNPASVKDRSRVSQDSLRQIVELGPSSPQVVKTLCKDIKNGAQVRALQAAFREAEAACNGETSPDKILESLESKLYGKISSSMAKSSDSKDVAERVLKSFMERLRTGGGVEVSTGLKKLDRAIIGLRPGKFFVLGARPSMGKSALAQTIGHSVCEQGYGVLTLSGEMPEDEILERAIAQYADVNVRKITAAKNLELDEVARINEAVSKIHPDRWRIVDKVSNISSVRRLARLEANRMERKGIKLALVIVDYMQLFAEGDNREQAVSAVSRGCKQMAADLGCTVMGLSQLNRGLEHRDDKRPIMADLRESGAIEQDADIIGFLYRGNKYNPSIPEEESELIIAKQRGGPIGSIPLRFIPRTTSFEDTYEHEPDTKLHTGPKDGAGAARGTDAPANSGSGPSVGASAG